jgi:AcrR family transcriptional regulator
MAGKKKTRPTDLRLGRRTSDAPGPSADDLARVALELFAERHYALVTIKDISLAARVSSAMIYYHFEDKEDLFCAAIERAINEAFDLFDSHAKSKQHDNPADAIGDWVDIHVALSMQLRNVVKISLDCKGLVEDIPEAHEQIKRFYRREDGILQKSVGEGIDLGIFRNVDPATVATMISTILDGVMARSIIQEDFEMVKTVEEIKAALWLYLGHSDRWPQSAGSLALATNADSTAPDC